MIINIPKYFSQFDGDTMWYEKNGKKYTGTCVETCLKMADCYLTGREVAIKDIVKNGDNNPEITSYTGAQKAAKWLGFTIYQHKPTSVQQIKEFLGYGHLIIAIVQYNYIPSTHRQISFEGGHALLITGIDEKNNSIRYADPAFSGATRNDGWMNNGKWISWNELKKAWEYYGYMAWEVQKSKDVPKPEPAPKPTPDPKDKEIETLKAEVKTLKDQNDDLKNDIFTTPNKEYIKGKPKKAGWEYRVRVAEGNANDAEKRAKELGNKSVEIEKKLSATTELLNKKIAIIDGLKNDIEKIKEEKDLELGKNVTLQKNNDDLTQENKELRNKIINLTENINQEDLENIFVKLFKKFINIFKKANS